MILCIKSDSDQLELRLATNPNEQVSQVFETGRKLALKLPRLIDTFLNDQGHQLTDISGIVCYEGPGSFTGLRIGHTYANALAYSLALPIVQAGGESWVASGIELLRSGKNEKIVIPRYGSEAHISVQKSKNNNVQPLAY